MTALTITRARAPQPFATRERLGAALEWWRQPADMADEWLILPHLCVKGADRPHAPASALARQLDAALLQAREGAAVDPLPGTFPSGALRFTRAERWLAWLAVRPGRSDGRSPTGAIEATGEAPRETVRRAVLACPTMLLSVTGLLLRAGKLPDWAARWDAAEIAQLATCLALHFGIGVPETRSAAAPRVSEETDLNPLHPGTLPRALNPARQQAYALLLPLASDPAWLCLAPARRTNALVLAGLALRPAAAPVLQAIALRLAATPQAGPAKAAANKPVTAADSPADSGANADPPMTPRPGERRTGQTPPRRDAPVWSTPSPRRTADAKAPQSPPRLRAPEHAATHAAAERQAWPAEPRTAFTSRHAGLLFLLNAFLALDLYPDFTRPQAPRLAPSPLWLLARLGHSWFGRSFARDPLADWLNDQAVPGRCPRTWRVRPAWEPGKSALRRYSHARWIIDWDARGFPARVGLRTNRDIDHPALPMARARRMDLTAPTQDKVWTACLGLYLDHRLRSAGTSRAALRLPGIVAITPERATARFMLADLPLALRIAGLDRNPGWIPAEGRIFEFEFA